MFRHIWDQGDRQSKEIVFHALELTMREPEHVIAPVLLGK